MNDTDKINLHKEIDLIQDCIKRMASNSFLLKGWTISIVAVVLALSVKDVNIYYLCGVLLIPIISFWYLDAFFLYTEKLYREMYNWVIKVRPEGIKDKTYDLNPHRFKAELKVRKWDKKICEMQETGKIESIGSVMWSVTLRCFYFIPLALILLIVIGYSVKLNYKDCSERKTTSATTFSARQPLKQCVIDTIHGTTIESSEQSKKP